MKKLTYDFVKSEFEKRNYVLLETEYVNNRTKMRYICDKGHENYIRYDDLKRGKGCKKCAYVNLSEKKKRSFSYIKNYIEKENYKLLSNESNYINNKSKLKILCDKGHVYISRWNSFQMGNRCPKCANNIRYDFKYIKNVIKEKLPNYKLLSKKEDYINNISKLNLRCDNGHIWNVCFRSILNNHKCNKCKYEKMLGSNHPRWIYDRTNLSIVKEHHRKSTRFKNKFKKENPLKKDCNMTVDHIFPIKVFIDMGIEDPEIINYSLNLQYLSLKENASKGCKFDINKFHKYMRNFPEWKYNKKTFKYEKEET